MRAGPLVEPALIRYIYIMRYHCCLALAGLFAVSTLGAQEPAPAGVETAEEAPSEAVFAPFPSKLRAALREGQVVLSWEDSADVKGRYAVYRSLAPIDGLSAFAGAEKVGEVESGIGTYVDRPSGGAAYYYLVLAVGSEGEPYKVFIPARNTTLAAIALPPSESLPAAPAPAAPATPAAATAAEPPSLEGVAAAQAKDAVVVSYRSRIPGQRLVLYRSSQPILGSASLLDAVLVAAFEDKSGAIADYPVPGVDYWYAILPEEELRAGRLSVEPGRNATRDSVSIPAGLYRVGLPATPPLSRTPPLPSFLLEKGLVAGPGETAAPLAAPAASAEYRELGPEAAKAAALLLEGAPRLEAQRPPVTILPEERKSPSGGEDYALALIAREKLLPGDAAGAAEQLRKYLSLNRGPRAAARARYYLGEALAVEGAYREAFFEFLRARELFAAETAPWIDYLIAVLRRG